MKNYCIVISFVVALLFLYNKAQANSVSDHLLEANSSSTELRSSSYLDCVNDLNSSVYYDSASLDSFIYDYMDSAHIPGLATWALKNGEVIWQKCYGYANLEDSIEVADTTLFTLWSISKTVTGTAIMQLWERGEFELDDDINDYLPFDVRCPS